MIKLTPEILEFIKSNYGRLTTLEIANKLNTTPNAIRHITHRNNIKKPQKIKNVADISKKESKITKDQEKFILDNYPKFGTRYCADNLNISEKLVRFFASKKRLNLTDSGLEITKKQRMDEKQKTLYKDFTPEFDDMQSYALGLLWADGYLYVNKSRSLKFSCVEKDFYDFEHSLSKLGKLSYLKRTRIGRQPQIDAYIRNYGLTKWLFDNDFCNKSKISPNKILENIRKEYHKDFLRGWIDGDGCFYVNLKRKMFQFSISGTYEQDWTSLTNLLDDIGVSYKIDRRIRHEKSKSSTVRSCGYKNINKIVKYIYNNHSMCLKRKYDKAMIISHYCINGGQLSKRLSLT